MPISANDAIPPDMNPELAQDLKAWSAANQLITQYYAQMKALAAGLTSTGNVMYEVMLFMNAYGNVQGAQVQSESAVSNVDSDVRNLLSSAQSDFNTASTLAGSSSTEPQAIPYLNKLVAVVNQINVFIKYEAKLPTNEQVIDPTSLTNLQNAISSITTPFSPNWGNGTEMADMLYGWQNQSATDTYSPSTIQGIQNGFQTLNQTVSGLSTTANTLLQFIAQQAQQFLGMENSASTAFITQEGTFVTNQKSQ